jgi:hypothetical protein
MSIWRRGIRATENCGSGHRGDYRICHYYGHRVDDQAVSEPQQRGPCLNLAQGRRLFEKVRAREHGRG